MASLDLLQGPWMHSSGVRLTVTGDLCTFSSGATHKILNGTQMAGWAITGASEHSVQWERSGEQAEWRREITSRDRVQEQSDSRTRRPTRNGSQQTPPSTPMRPPSHGQDDGHQHTDRSLPQNFNAYMKSPYRSGEPVTSQREIGRFADDNDSPDNRPRRCNRNGNYQQSMFDPQTKSHLRQKENISDRCQSQSLVDPADSSDVAKPPTNTRDKRSKNDAVDFVIESGNARMNPSEREELVALYRAAFSDEFDWMESQGRSTTRKMPALQAWDLVVGDKQLYIARASNGQLLGFATVQHCGRECWLRGLAVREDCRGQGIGRELVRGATPVRHCSFQVEFWKGRPASLEKFYTSLGFQRMQRAQHGPYVTMSLE